MLLKVYVNARILSYCTANFDLRFGRAQDFLNAEFAEAQRICYTTNCANFTNENWLREFVVWLKNSGMTRANFGKYFLTAEKMLVDFAQEKHSAND